MAFQLDAVSHTGNLYALSESVPVDVPGMLRYPYILVFSETREIAVSFRMKTYQVACGQACLFPTAVLKSAPQGDGIYYVYFSAVHTNIGLPKLLCAENKRELTRLFRRMHASYEEGTAEGYLAAVSDFYRVFSLFAALPGNFDFYSKLSRGVQYIRSHFHEPDFALSDLNLACGIGEDTFRRHMQDVAGMTPKEYLDGLRLSYADRLLEAGESIDKAATLAGFGSVKHFTAVSRRLRGELPRARKKMLEENKTIRREAAYALLRSLSDEDFLLLQKNGNKKSRKSEP